MLSKPNKKTRFDCMTGCATYISVELVFELVVSEILGSGEEGGWGEFECNLLEATLGWAFDFWSPKKWGGASNENDRRTMTIQDVS